MNHLDFDSAAHHFEGLQDDSGPLSVGGFSSFMPSPTKPVDAIVPYASLSPEALSFHLELQVKDWRAACETWRMTFFESSDIDADYTKTLKNLAELESVTGSLRTQKVQNIVANALTKMRTEIERGHSIATKTRRVAERDLLGSLPRLHEDGKALRKDLDEYSTKYGGWVGESPPSHLCVVSTEDVQCLFCIQGKWSSR